jgi:hypothetical protein
MIHHVFANKSNIGDWLSAIGIQKLLAPEPVVEHLCDEPFVPETIAALEKLTERDFIVIGGGGLFMDYFEPFWRAFEPVSRRVPFAVWAAGCCHMKRADSKLSADLINTIVSRSALCSVRDEMTCAYLKTSGRVGLPIACTTFNAIDTEPVVGDGGVLHVDAYDNVGDEVYTFMVAELEKFAERTGRRYRQTNNLIAHAGSQSLLQSVLDLYRKSDVVVTSRLHGCIIAAAMGRPQLAVSGDHKVESFMHAAGLGDWVLDLAEMGRFVEKLEGAEKQEGIEVFVGSTRQANREIAAQIKSMQRR